MSTEPMTTLDGRYSSPGAAPTPWTIGDQTLEQAEIYWISTVRPDGRPHVTPMIAVWLDNTLYFTTGAGERKAMNLASNPACVITTGCNRYGEGVDIVLEGTASEITDQVQLERLAAAYKQKYDWNFTARNGRIYLEGQDEPPLAFAVSPGNTFGFGRGETFSQTRWHFGHREGDL